MNAMAHERDKIRTLFNRLKKAAIRKFPLPHRAMDAPCTHGVYVIRNKNGTVVQVGRTQRGSKGLRQRLYDHLSGRSSFTRVYLKGKGKKLRNGYTFQYLCISYRPQRTLLENFATAWHCPKHLGLGKKKASKL